MEFQIRFADYHELSIMSWDCLSQKHFQWKAENKEIIVAENEDNIILGYLRLEFLWSKYPYIGLIIVNEDCREQGVGKALLNFLEDYLKVNGLTVLYSYSQVNEEGPQKWHRHRGFKECGIINEINDGIGEVFFRKEL